VKQLESDDPFELVAVPRAEDIDLATDSETARCLIEEYALSGFAATEVADLFTTAQYSMPHAIYQRRGPDFVVSLIKEVFGINR